MDEKNFDPAVITTTTVTSQTTTTKVTTRSSMKVTFDKSFAKSPQGFLALLEIIYSLTAFIVVVCGDHSNSNSGTFTFFLIVTFVVFFFTLCFYIGQLTHLRYKIQLPWTKLDILVYTIYILVLVTSASLVAVHARSASHGAGATLGFVLMQFYMISLGLTIMQYRATRAMIRQSSGAKGAAKTGNTIGEPDNLYGGPGPTY